MADDAAREPLVVDFEPLAAVLRERADPGPVGERWAGWCADLAACQPTALTVQDSQGSRPRSLRLLPLVTDRELDTTYQLEWAEICLADDGWWYLVIRYREFPAIATRWSPGLTLPESLWRQVPPWLAAYL